MATDPIWINSLLKTLNAPLTGRNRTLLNAWGRAEGGHTHNTARWNWLNTSRKGYGGVSAGIGSVPWIKAYPDFDRGIRATADTIKWGYPSILKGLRAGGPSLQDPGVQSDLSRWVSGKRAPVASSYVNRIASLMGDTALTAGPATDTTAPTKQADRLAQTITVPQAPEVKRSVTPRVTKQELLGSLLQASQRGDYGEFFKTLIDYKNPIVQTRIVTPRPRLETIKPIPTPRGTKKNPTVSIDHSDPVSPTIAPTIKLAKQYLGTPYKWGGASPRTGFDCSGFIQWLYGQRGIKTGRTTWEQAKHGRFVPRSQLRPGDAILFNTHSFRSHEGMYIGDGQFIHAPHTGDVVKISSLNDPFYSRAYESARRFV